MSDLDHSLTCPFCNKYYMFSSEEHNGVCHRCLQEVVQFVLNIKRGKNFEILKEMMKSNG